MSDLQRLAKGAAFQPQSTSPLSEEGDMYYDGITKKFYYHDGSSQKPLGSGEGGGGAGMSPSNGFKVLFNEKFAAGFGTADSKISSAHTTASYGSGIVTVNFDKSKTITTSGINYTFSAAPSYTIQVGDVVAIAGNIWRRVASVNTTTTGTLDAAFAVDQSGATCMVSQSVTTKNLVSFGVAGGTSFDAFGSVAHMSANVYYSDSNSVDQLPDYNTSGRITAAVSNSGLSGTVTPPASTTYGPTFTRPAISGLSVNAAMNINATQEALFATFFADFSSLTGSGLVYLYEIRLSAYPNNNVYAGGVLASGYGYTDNSGTFNNMSPMSVAGGKTRVTLPWTYVPNANPGSDSGDLEVKLEGREIPRFYAGVQGAYYVEVSPTQFDLYVDASGYTWSVSAKRRQGLGDSNPGNTAKLGAIYDAIVGSASQLAIGACTHTSINTAIAAVQTNGQIMILKGSYTEAVVVNKAVNIFGQGYGTVINGTTTFSGNYASVSNLKFGGNVTVNSGATGNSVMPFWIATGSTVTDNGTDTLFLGVNNA